MYQCVLFVDVERIGYAPGTTMWCVYTQMVCVTVLGAHGVVRSVVDIGIGLMVTSSLGGKERSWAVLGQ